MKFLLKSLAVILNALPKTDWKPIPLCDVYGRYGLDAPNLVGHVTAPSVTTDSTPSSVTASSAVFDTNSISSTGGENASTRGIVYMVGAGGSPTTSNSVVSTNGSYSTGNFSATMSGLASGTTYSVRAFATNSGGTGYGSTVEVTTLAIGPPSVTTNTPTNITSSTATANGNITSINGAAPTERGFVWATYSSPTVSNNQGKVFTTGSYSTGTYTGAITGLSPFTTYYVRAYAINSNGTGYGSAVSFQTPAVTTATPSGQYLSDGITPVSIGGITGTSGVTTDLNLEVDLKLASPTLPVTTKYEILPVGSTFTNTVTDTSGARTFRASTLPLSYRGSTMVYDSVNDRMVKFGGFDGTNRTAEFWAINLNDSLGLYRQVTPTGTLPVARNLHASTGFTLSGRSFMVVWGGAITLSPQETNNMNITELTTVGSEVSADIAQTNAPTLRSYIPEHMVSKKISETQVEIYLFGGWAASYENAVYKCTYTLGTNAVTWSVVGAQGAANAPETGRRGSNCMYDPASDSIFVFGGYNGSFYSTLMYRFNLANNTWTELSYTGDTAASRELGSSAYDPTTKMWYIFGGYLDTPTSSKNDIIRFDMSNPAVPVCLIIRANNVGDSSFYPQSSMCCAFDSRRRNVILGSGNGYDDFYKYMYLFDPKEEQTSEATIYGLSIQDDFRARDAPAFAYNPDRGEMLMVGGWSEMGDDTTITTGAHTGQMWTVKYELGSNTKVRYATAGLKTVTPREGSMMVYDTIEDRFILFGGLNGIERMMDDVWEIKADEYGNYKVREMKPAGGLRPAPRWLGAAAFDATNNRMVIWGGETMGALVNNGDMWALKLGTDSVNGEWEQIFPTGTAPAARWQPAYWHKTSTNQLFITGGSTTSGDSSYASDLVRLDLTPLQPAWTSLTSTSNKAVRGGILVGGDTVGGLFYFGGSTSSTANNTVLTVSQTGGTWATRSVTIDTPEARRSLAGYVYFENTGDGTVDFIISSGRPVSGTWYSDVYRITVPPSGAEGSKAAFIPTVRMSLPVRSKTDNTAYHWQAWATSNSTDTAKVSFGGNAESATDFATGTGGGGSTPTGYKKLYIGGAWTRKPQKYHNGSAWVIKPVKVNRSGTWGQSS